MTVSYDQPVLITAYKYADTPSRGRIGTVLPVVAPENLVEGQHSIDLPWISHSADPAVGSSATLSFISPFPRPAPT